MWEPVSNYMWEALPGCFMLLFEELCITYSGKEVKQMAVSVAASPRAILLGTDAQLEAQLKVESWEKS